MHRCSGLRVKAGELVTGEVIEVLGERLTVTGPGRAEHRGDRHSAATHLGEAGTDATVIMTKGHWQSIRTAARYTRPGLHAITTATEELNPPHRRS